MPHRHAGGLQDEGSEGHPDVDQDGEGQPQDDGAAGYAGRSQYAGPRYMNAGRYGHDLLLRLYRSNSVSI